MYVYYLYIELCKKCFSNDLEIGFKWRKRADIWKVLSM